MNEDNKELALATGMTVYFLAVTFGISAYALLSTGMVGFLTLAPMLLYFCSAWVVKANRVFGYVCLAVSIASYCLLIGGGFPYGLFYTLLVELGSIVYLSLKGVKK